jgi:hypothetical protein
MTKTCCYVVSLIDPNIVLNTMFTYTTDLCSFLKMSDKLSHPYKTTDRITRRPDRILLISEIFHHISSRNNNIHILILVLRLILLVVTLLSAL